MVALMMAVLRRGRADALLQHSASKCVLVGVLGRLLPAPRRDSYRTQCNRYLAAARKQSSDGSITKESKAEGAMTLAASSAA
ncbi:MAG: hypothetical protein JNK88_07965 [Mangrovicoccus sp.]|nr:hypothetical protein [Mangrovicoccus sp.]